MEINKDELVGMLKSAQSRNTICEHDIIVYIRDTYMKRRLAKYLNRNRQAENEDIQQEFLIGVALAIRTVRFDIGDPIEYLIGQGIYRVRSFLRKQIISNTVQVCEECGHITRLNRIGTDYICKKCGSSRVTTTEINDHNELVLEGVQEQDDKFDALVSQMFVEQFGKTLDQNTNVYALFNLLTDGEINRDNPHIKNYIKEIAKMWGGCSEQNVIQNMDKLKKKVIQYAEDNGMTIRGTKFIVME